MIQRGIEGTLVCLILFFAVSPAAFGQISYEISFPNAVHNEAEIKLRVEGVPDTPLEMRMSRTSPGRYSLHEFAKNVYSVHATDETGRPLDITRPSPHQWDVHGHSGTVILYYTLYADRADGTYSQIDTTHGHLNMPATFMFPRNHKDWPVSITFNPPPDSDWKIATQLFPTEDPLTYTAPDLFYFMDSPTELSNFSIRSWTIPRGPGEEGTYEIRLAMHHTGTDRELDEYTDMVREVVNQQVAIFGTPPPFETNTYTFIADYLPWASGDGMEHRNSTILTSSSSLASNAVGLLGTVSHEFFHAWNVERIRPAALEPFNFESANMADEMWFAEGFTSYYTTLTIRRTGIMDDEAYAAAISSGLNTVINSPGRHYFNPMEMSLRAPLVDRATSNDPTNLPNIFISYYTWGAMIGLNLDLTLRQRGLSLDAYMRYLWEKYGVDEIPFAASGLEDALADYTGDRSFARSFFDRYIRDSHVPDYKKLLEQAGYLLQLAHPEKAYLGNLYLQYDIDGANILTNTLKGTPVYEAGLDRGDKIIKLDGRVLSSETVLQEVLDQHNPGDTINVTYSQRGKQKSAVITLTANPNIEVIPFEKAGKTLNSDQEAFRKSWLSGRN